MDVPTTVQTDAAVQAAPAGCRSTVPDSLDVDGDTESIFRDLVSLVTRCFGSATVQLRVSTPERIWHRTSEAGAVPSREMRDHLDTLCAAVSSGRRAIVVPESAASAEFPDLAASGIQFFAAVPLVAADGSVLGTLSAWDRTPHDSSPADIEALQHFGRHVVAVLELRRTSMRLDASEVLLAASASVLELIVGGADLATVLNTLAGAVEVAVPETRCSILLLDGVILHHGAGPSLPKVYRDAIDGVRIGPAVGSCGTAAYRRETVIVSDIATDPLWTDYRQAAHDAGLRACWSVPILDAGRQVLGTFALYYDEVRSPTDDELGDLSRWVNLAEIAISRAGEVAALREAATLDGLTGLVNRAEVLRMLQAAVDADSGLAVLFVDLDQFKFVNDTLGHRAGDAFLQEVARRLNGCLAPQDTASRFGGDEFLLLCPSVDSVEAARGLAQRIIATLQQPVNIYGDTLALSASVGITMRTKQYRLGSADLVGEADLAMYAAKRSGRNSVAVFDHELRRHAASRLSLEGELSRALIEGELDCGYQPIVSLVTGEMVAVEALLRWDSKTRGSVPPMEFISTAEDSGQIVAIGELVLRRACRQLTAWQAENPLWRAMTLWINISPRQLRDGGFTMLVEQILAETGLPAENLGLEVTESTLIGDEPMARSALTHLRDLGVHVAVDDFGTGYSSLAQLKYLPVDVLKIDQLFVSGMTTSTTDAGIIAAILSLATTLGLRVTAEGVETIAQREKLLALGCTTGQGFLFSRPLSADLLADHIGRSGWNLFNPPWVTTTPSITR